MQVGSTTGPPQTTAGPLPTAGKLGPAAVDRRARAGGPAVDRRPPPP
ncbi:hypothetical protein A2U01_0042002 [Trifolium medium]|uniref:Uncharacterized protein n=1 Tax=Trifolium medium TaxID=97028 RepID=A0A392QAE1_9FABA|nr:hypothetical protein [Trifolium medium]